MLVQSVLQHMPVVLPANSDAFVVSRAGSACAEHVAAYKTNRSEASGFGRLILTLTALAVFFGFPAFVFCCCEVTMKQIS